MWKPCKERVLFPEYNSFDFSIQKSLSLLHNITYTICNHFCRFWLIIISAYSTDGRLVAIITTREWVDKGLKYIYTHLGPQLWVEDLVLSDEQKFSSCYTGYLRRDVVVECYTMSVYYPTPSTFQNCMILAIRNGVSLLSLTRGSQPQVNLPICVINPRVRGKLKDTYIKYIYHNKYIYV